MALATGIAPARADPRCARLGQPAYSAMRLTSAGGAPATAARVTLDGPRQRIEARGPGEGRLVTLITPEFHAVFLTSAQPAVALRLAPPPATAAPAPQDRREREERSRGQVTFIIELRGVSGQWHAVERNTCRRDGVLLEAWQWQPSPAGGLVLETRQSDIRLARPDPALFQLPAGFRLAEAPPAARP
ncbi:hypothetical protein [Sediminicoccus sp. KRV36]|uniref:hypothetical protein n=1 Tax=Sediminicoccus sp. KRV36 TaxID=3133721 RepID=UPI00200FE743|nr:hypothetical protein [Sediminicoccus rosea]UPY36155.1 hypothetical protein LHU95_18335 [Sediminicoccus rosea]